MLLHWVKVISLLFLLNSPSCHSFSLHSLPFHDHDQTIAPATTTFTAEKLPQIVMAGVPTIPLTDHMYIVWYRFRITKHEKTSFFLHESRCNWEGLIPYRCTHTPALAYGPAHASILSCFSHTVFNFVLFIFFFSLSFSFFFSILCFFLNSCILSKKEHFFKSHEDF